ncbi:hypothetical protein RRK67_004032 [Vibrio fluvialis]|nr:hypothetical protein [Vibrio fluvialis]
MKNSNVSIFINKPALSIGSILFLTALVVLFPNLAQAADLFSGGKSVVTENVGDGSTINYVVIMVAALSGIVVGIMQKNWVMGIGLFVVANIFWSVAMGVAGGI